MGSRACSYPSSDFQPKTPWRCAARCFSAYAKDAYSTSTRRGRPRQGCGRPLAVPASPILLRPRGRSTATACLPAGRVLVPCIRGLSSTPMQQGRPTKECSHFESLEPCSWPRGWRIPSGRRFMDHGTQNRRVTSTQTLLQNGGHSKKVLHTRK